MKRTARFAGCSALLLLLAGTLGCAKLKARDQLEKGIQAFKANQYESAVGHFQQSIALDPSYDTAKLYLATAYSYQVVPGDSSPSNLKNAQKALDGFNEVLSKNPNDVDALRQIASIHRNIKAYDLAKADEEKVIAAAPNDAEAEYTLGQIYWQEAYNHAVETLAAAGLTDDGEGNVKKSKEVCQKLISLNTDLVNNAQKHLMRAVELNPNYDDAMTYLNLNWRRKADFECGNDAARKADLAQADDWVKKAMGAKKINEAEKEKKLGGGVTMK
jgi:tetratricopeptide (TPR) repeat protein